ncbi:hypothetical protein BEWA_041840 [Theileria equi strain WA]|uniref:Uncharacterized protein n=1 Tax=Theileria equi strain WA TaxID=1537102 RepID=L1LFL4_THEEQ|nr:hypothetical protein BEWA_041840 [Theileria equi strain WA]EKX74146.1 hypothetical protein BEWA_041840 [Theileria equi strain WA]|eukprot:XP_004833598.1 hypothetical protein BEWA_041840 [Theileria equi strain WA]
MNPFGDLALVREPEDITLDITNINSTIVNYYESTTSHGIYKFYFPSSVNHFIKVTDGGRTIWEPVEEEKCAIVFSHEINGITQLTIHVRFPLGDYQLKYFIRRDGHEEWEPSIEGDDEEHHEALIPETYQGMMDEWLDDLIAEHQGDWGQGVEHGGGDSSPAQIVPEGPGTLYGSFYIEELSLNDGVWNDANFDDDEDDRMQVYVVDDSRLQSILEREQQMNRDDEIRERGSSSESDSESSDAVPRKRLRRMDDASNSGANAGSSTNQIPGRQENSPRVSSSESATSHQNLEDASSSDMVSSSSNNTNE